MTAFDSVPPLRWVALFLVCLVLGAAFVAGPVVAVRKQLGDSSAGAEYAAAGKAFSGPPGSGQSGAMDSRDGPEPLLVWPAPAAAGPKLASALPVLQGPSPDAGSVLALERKLHELSYLPGPVDGVFGQDTAFGIRAFEKVEGLPPTGAPGPEVLARLDMAKRPTAAYSTPAIHLEVNIARQVVHVVSGGVVTQTISTSTGNGKVFRSQGRRSRAVTPNGQFTITRKMNGWRRSPLGMLYRPAYFNGGIAFHGARSVPDSPASHGCVRLPMVFADRFADEDSPVGRVVYVYGNPGEANPPAVSDAGAPPLPYGPPPDLGPAGSPPQPGEPGPAPPGSSPSLLGGILSR